MHFRVLSTLIDVTVNFLLHYFDFTWWTRQGSSWSGRIVEAVAINRLRLVDLLDRASFSTLLVYNVMVGPAFVHPRLFIYSLPQHHEVFHCIGYCCRYGAFGVWADTDCIYD